MGEEKKVYSVLVGKSEGKRPFERPRRRWEDEIRMDIGESGLGGVEWIQLAQDRGRWRAVINTAIHLRVLEPHSDYISIILADEYRCEAPCYGVYTISLLGSNVHFSMFSDVPSLLFFLNEYLGV
jgi:hypothetical protein